MDKTLQLGDILLFKTEERAISKLISWLTDSDVGHSSMIYSENVMIEMGPAGVMVSPIAVGYGEATYQSRLSPALDPQPLLDAARAYVEQKPCYDMPALVLLGALLVYRHIRPSTPKFRLIDRVLNFAVIEIDGLLKKLMRHPDAMVCSQFVYQIYQDCPEPYHIVIEGGNLQPERNGVRLIDEARSAGANALDSWPPQASDEAVDALLAELWEVIQQEEQDVNELSDCVPNVKNQLLDTVRTFDGVLQRLLEQARMPLDALLVTPADLAYHAKNLVRIGDLEVERI